MDNINIKLGAIIAVIAKQLATSNMILVMLAEQKAAKEGVEFSEVFKTLHDEIHKEASVFLDMMLPGSKVDLSNTTIDDLLK